MRHFHACATIALIVAGCTAEQTTEGCVDDSSCDPGFFCDGGSCKCRTDDACGAGKRCNDFGNCQERPPCLGNDDCDDGMICNSSAASGGDCIPASQCGSSVHCEFNDYCKIATGGTTGECTPGCRNSGDCQLGYICSAGICQVGGCDECPATPSPDASYCDFGERCTSSGQCVATTSKANYCTTCNGTTPCASKDLACIIDNESCACLEGKCYPTNTACNTDADCGGACNVSYCAPTCKVDSDCPNGYGSSCGGLIQVCGVCDAGNPCTNGGDCLYGAESSAGFCSCTSQADCALPTGICEAFFGTCLWGCSTDADCALLGTTCNESWGVCDISCSSDAQCICVNNTCANSGLPCSTAADCQSTFVTVETPTGYSYGVCETNVKVCGKDSGVLCEDLDGDAACATLN